MGDEIGSGAAPPPRRARALLVGLVVAAVVVAGVVALRRGVDPVEVQPPASPPAAQMPRPPGQLAPTEELPPVPALTVAQVCRPLRTDGRTTLDVRFTLVNTLAQPVTLVRITPVFPLRGLRALRTEIRSGTCAASGPPLPTGAIGGHAAALVSFRLGLPPTCPTPLPVEAAPSPPACTCSATSPASPSPPADPSSHAHASPLLHMAIPNCRTTSRSPAGSRSRGG
jgi:hypothetical protein